MVLMYKEILSGGGIEEILIPTTASLMKIELADGSLTTKGQFQKDGTWQVLGAIKASDFSKVLTISATGIYSIEVSGLYSVQFTYTGSGGIKFKLMG